MGQIKIYGLRSHLQPIRTQLSSVLHQCVVDVFQYPQDKRAHRFFYLEPEDFYYPEGRSEKYTIVEILLFEGRSVTTKKTLYQHIFSEFEKHLKIAPTDVEITLIETPMHNWGIRGAAGDELALGYQVQI